MKKNKLLNIAVLRKMAMPILKAFKYKKGASMKKKMLAAALKPNVKKINTTNSQWNYIKNPNAIALSAALENLYL